MAAAQCPSCGLVPDMVQLFVTSDMDDTNCEECVSKMVAELTSIENECENTQERTEYLNNMLLELTTDGKARAVEVLLKACGPRVNINCVDRDGKSPLIIAAAMGHIKTAKVILGCFLRPPRGSLELVFTKFINLVSLEPFHHKPMGRYARCHSMPWKR